MTDETMQSLAIILIGLGLLITQLTIILIIKKRLKD